MQGGVGAPWPPRFGAGEQRGGGRPALRRRHRAQQADIRGGECVGLVQRPHGDILRGPFADARQRAQPRDHLIQSASGLEQARVGGGGLGQRHN